MDSQLIPLVRRTIRLNGGAYDLMAVAVGGGDYQGSWRCAQCEVGGASKLAYPHSGNAIDWAQNCAEAHERELHAEIR